MLLCLPVFMMFPAYIMAQKETGILPVDRFNSFAEKAVFEKIFLHSDRDFYVAGEILWFKIYYTEGDTHRPLSFSKVGYVEIINEQHIPVLQTKISLEKEESGGSFYLPVTLNTGHYILRAYTNWMKNFGSEYFFEKVITIVNTLKEPEAGPRKDTADPVSIHFYPEGGNLVRDVTTRIGFKAEDRNGYLKTITGYITDDRGDTITSFSPLRFGIGSFEFTPRKGRAYSASLRLPDGKILKKDLPGILEEGYAIHLAGKDRDHIEVTLSKAGKAGEYGQEPVLLVSHSRREIKTAERILLENNGSSSIIIDKSKLGEGVVYFTLFNGNNHPVCERLLFLKPESGASLEIGSDKGQYTSRQEVSLNFKFLASPEKTKMAHISTSVFIYDSLHIEDTENIYEYMWLISDIPGEVESPGYYFSDDPLAETAADNLMLTQGWRKFIWNEVLAGGDSIIKFLPEIQGQLVTGSITEKKHQQPVEYVDAYLSIPGKPFGFYVSKSEKNGSVEFEVDNYYGNRQVIIRPGIDSGISYQMEINRPFAKTPPFHQIKPAVLPERMKDQLLQESISMQVQNLYTGDSLRKFAEPEITDSLPFYALPEKRYLLDNYKRFTTMEEVLREYVSEINVGVRNRKPILKMFNPVTNDFYSSPILVLLDGVSLSDMNSIFSYDPLKVRKLEIIQSRYVLGQSVFSGIASFTTYNNRFDGFELDPNLVSIDYEGLQLQRVFYSPVYNTLEQVENRLPDFRNTLYWAPGLATDNKGTTTLRFFTSDKKGKYMVVAQGISTDGDLVSGKTVFEVK